MANRLEGKVSRLYVRGETTFIKLDTDPEVSPLNGYFELKLDNKNYNALYSLALAAAANRWILHIRNRDPITNDEIVKTREGEVLYLFVDWAAGQ